MNVASTVAHVLIRFTGLLQIVLGLLFWTGNALSLIPIHMLVGLVLVLSLWTLAFLAARAGVHPGFVALAAIWGLVVPILGFTQAQLLPGDTHWVIEILHLLLGLGAIGQGEGLAARIKRARAPILQR
jgi:hypothetical protein